MVMARYLYLVIACFFYFKAGSQPMSGTTGLLNVPSAEMQSDGTFFMGASYLPEDFTPDVFNYDTGNYYFNITFLPFLEINYRLTLFKYDDGGYNQDRSFGMRLRLLKEKKLMPSLVVGGNDLYTSGGMKTGYFNSLYGVATKRININRSQVGVTAGYAYEGLNSFSKANLKGIFGGVSVSPGFLPALKVIGEYDSVGINTGVTAMVLNHFFVYGFVRDFTTPAGGLAWYIYL
jgi:hypothetical protein